MRSPVRFRRHLAGVAVPLLLFTTAACGGSDEPADDAADTPSATEPSETVTEEEPETEESEEPAPAAEGELTTETFLPALKEAVKGNESVHIEMNLETAGQVLEAEGDAQFDEDDPAMALRMQGPAFGTGVADVRLVDDAVYLSIPPLTQPGEFIKVDPNDPNDPLAANLGDLTDSLDPTGTFDAFDAGLREVTYVGEESVDGETLDHYRVKVDFEAASKAQGQPVIPGVPKFVTYDIWVDDANLMRRIDFTLGSQVDLTMTASEWGEPVTVKAPPPSKITKAPPQLGGPGPA